MTEKYFFDTDCVSAFLWVRGESILSALYSRRIVLPAQVYEELKRVPHLLKRVDTMKDRGDLVIESIEMDSAEYYDYLQMTTRPEAGMRIIGKGEAAGIAMAKARDGILASNNLKDISAYVEKYDLKYITTGDILVEALRKGLISEKEGDMLWMAMIRKRRSLPAKSFTEYMRDRKVEL